MAETTTITVRVPLETKAKLDRLAAATRRSRAFLAAEALETYVKREIEIVEGILEGLADVEAGRTVPHEQVVAEIEEIIAAAEARQATSRRKASAGRR